jgi:hypothetical protein
MDFDESLCFTNKKQRLKIIHNTYIAMYSKKEILVPEEYSFPLDFDSFSPEENACLLTAGYQYLKGVKEGIFEKRGDLELKIRAIFENELMEKDGKIKSLMQLNETTKTLYDEWMRKERENTKREIFEMTSKEMEKLRELLELEKQKSKLFELDKVRLEEKVNQSLDHTLLLKMKEMEMQFLREKEEWNQRMQKMVEEHTKYKIGVLEKENAAMNVKQQNTVAKQRGNNGEELLQELLQRTFSSLNCTIENTSGGNHKGDFHLKFDKFTVLVDCKNYIDSKQVNVESRKQIKNDLEQNRHIKIAWLISLNRPISKYGGVPWQFDIEDGICCFYVNELLLHGSPEDTLKMLWKSSCILYSILDTNCETGELSRLKEYEIRVKEIYERLNNLSKQRHSILLQSMNNMQQLKDNFFETDKTDVELIKRHISDINELHTITVRDWWSSHVVVAKGSKLKIEQVYTKFIELEENQRIEKELFRDILCKLVKEEDIQKAKTKNASWTILNYGWVP